LVLVFVLELDEVGNFGAARSAPGGPKIQKDDSAVGIGKSDRFAVEAGKLEVRRRIGIAHEADGGLVSCGVARTGSKNGSKEIRR